jgi:hypothetical protein
MNLSLLLEGDFPQRLIDRVWQIDRRMDDIRSLAPSRGRYRGARTRGRPMRRGYREFIRDNSLKRLEKFEQMKNKYDKDEQMQKVIKALNFKQDNPQHFKDTVEALDANDKRAFLMFIEEIALLNNSRILSTDFVFYNFSWDAILAYETDEFWDQNRIKKDDPYWALFRSFCEKMIAYRKKYPESDWPVSGLRV